jgi:hypothetical protein
MQRAQNITNAAQGASNAMASMAGALGQDGGGFSLKGGSNNSIPSGMSQALDQASIDAAKNYIGKDALTEEVLKSNRTPSFMK